MIELLKDRNRTDKKKIILIGGGHAHVKFMYLMRHKGGYEDYDVVLVSKSRWQYYSGMLGGFLEGIYQEEDLRFDLAELSKRSNVTFIEEEVLLIQQKECSVLLGNDNLMHFDFLSIDIGSEVQGLELAGVKEYAKQIKPFNNIICHKQELMEQSGFDEPIIFAGGGPAGIELALSLKMVLMHHNKSFSITIIDSQIKVATGYQENFKKHITEKLKNEGMESILGLSVEELKKDRALLNNGTVVPFSFIFWATGPKASEIIKSSGIETDGRGYVLVNKYLQSINDPRIFGAGDCIGFNKEQYIRKAGVYAVREADYLYHNMKASMNGQLLKAYKPQKDYLSIISVGGHKGLLQYKGIIMEGKLCWHIKDYIDRNFMRSMKS